MEATRLLGVRPRFKTICSCCEHILRKTILDIGPWQRTTFSGISDLHASIADVFECATSHCIICLAVIQSIIEHPRQDLPKDLHDMLNARANFDKHQAWSSFEEVCRDRGQVHDGVQWQENDMAVTLDELYNYTITTDGRTTFVVKTTHRSGKLLRECKLEANESKHSNAINIDAETGDIDSLALIRFWFAYCQQHHERCQDPRSPWWPTRLMYLQGDTATLIVSAVSKPREPYATLSHCWGQSRSVILTTDTFETFRGGLTIATLPPTFRDSMLLAIALGIQYIWIDCFCILQEGEGSEEDWARESRSMHKVYSHGIINIGATSASSSADGLPNYEPIHRLSFAPISVQLSSQAHPQDYDIWLSSDWWDHRLTGPQGPLLKRGWVVQERCLCKRMIHHTSHGLWWECATSRTPAKEPFSVMEEYSAGIAILNEFMRGEDMSKPVNEALYSWMMAMALYSAGQLTFPDKDKLHAIEGLLGELSRVSGETYTMGHPVSLLLPSLLWAVVEDAPAALNSRGMPSWCALSLDVPLELNANLDDHRLNGLLAAVVGLSSDCVILCLGRPLTARPTGGDDRRSMMALSEECLYWGLKITSSQRCELRAVFDNQAVYQRLLENLSVVTLLPILAPRSWDPRPAVARTFDDGVCMLMLEAMSNGLYRRIGVAGFDWAGGRYDEDIAAFETEFRKTPARVIMIC